MLSLASAQCVQQLQLVASVYTVGPILLSESLIDTKSSMVMRNDSDDSAYWPFQTLLFFCCCWNSTFVKEKTKDVLLGQLL